MKLQTIVICVLLLCAVAVVSCGRLSTNLSSFACKQSNRQINIFRPQGFMVKQRIRKHLESIDLEVYINKNYRQHPSCDICVNVTVNNERKKWLTIKHPSAVVLPGDTVQYSITKHYRYGPPKRFSCNLQVDGAIMKFLPKAMSPPSCPVNGASSTKRNYAAEKTLLEQTINGLLSSCDAMDVPKLLVLAEDKKAIESAREPLKRYVVDRLYSLLPSVDWHETVENVYGSPERIVLEVKTVLMKLKILHSIRGTDVAKIVTDFEELSRSAKDSDESGERMKFVRKPILRSCPVLRPKPATSSKKRNYAAEKALLEEKINDLLSFCEGTRVTKQLVLTDDYKGEQSVKALKRYVLDRLNSLHPSVDWDETVENVYLSQEKIVFDVKSELMKLKILHSIRGTDVAKNIVDYEELILSADDYEESSGDYDA
ncbi:uncharacterized protein LOC128716286 [Anopheles marshallii]|uniref:uncharacterized protein LOC128716286 n=1 Tax=Anopheles marshallii TaxID=1521116 RepID=UPI00237B3524|nr:uncharacterized protein LOC128716286 [Anopheles marshallii]